LFLGWVRSSFQPLGPGNLRAPPPFLYATCWASIPSNGAVAVAERLAVSASSVQFQLREPPLHARKLTTLLLRRQASHESTPLAALVLLPCWVGPGDSYGQPEAT